MSVRAHLTHHPRPDLPPPREDKKALRRVKPPLSSVTFSNFVYLLLLVLAIITGYFSYRMIQYKTEVGGWWNLALGKGPKQYTQVPVPASSEGYARQPGNDATVGEGLEILASALGLQADELAGAIAGVVREYVSPAKLSAIRTREASRSGAVKVLLEGAPDVAGKNAGGRKAAPFANPAAAASDSASSVVEGVMSGMGNFVGMDEP
ncbi:hypothetical protein AMATHDRAFT_149868 [Amanita thiersii Skay4041]|uniref:Uncharacterized protein n=1 Tax=Amanita thiersii Skay4041 TaxID=703135 RepID=A0A2A9NCV7_9AGAR|nr:hypothetical protein AMATHDRAFT_149868 [Amanita thiersii Skay4041]